VEVSRTEIEGLIIIQPRIFQDERGYFYETWKEETYRNLGIKEQFVQDNMSYSKRNVLRGLHFQEEPFAQGKLVSVLQGEVFDVVVDLRKESATFSKWFGITLSAENKTQFYIPKGFAHGFVVKSEDVIVLYKCTDYYNPTAERTIIWNDTDLNINWEIENPIVSEKDAKGEMLVKL
jgi:dTDP-4-dehydrorhamnose 3,5-epimerase